MENNNLLKIFRQKFLRNAKHAISARGSSVDQQNALAPIRRVGSCKEGDYLILQKSALDPPPPPSYKLRNESIKNYLEVSTLSFKISLEQ